MKAACVMLEVKPDRIDDFIAATAKNHGASLKEPGCLRFDLLQSADDPAKFMLYEVFESEGASKAHKQTPHYFEWRDAAEHLLAAPRKGIPYVPILPAAPEGWRSR
jgi:autoinducer 2-degrading protein